MATCSSVLAWRIPWTEEPGGHSPWGLRVGHDRRDLVCTHTYYGYHFSIWGLFFILLMVSFGELFFLKSDLPIFSF